MQVRLLGPVDIMVDGEERPVAGLRRKAVLATLALHVGKVVSTDRLVDAVWGETAPLTALNTLQHHVSHLRAMLGGKAAILARPPGYLLDLGEDGTDVQLAERLLRQGTQSADPRQRAQELRQALALWRGRPLVDVAGLAWVEGQAGRLDLLCQQIRRALAEAGLAAGGICIWCPSWNRWWPITRWMSSFTRSSWSRCTAAGGRRMRYLPISGCGPPSRRSWG